MSLHSLADQTRLLETLVNIPSSSQNSFGVNRVQDKVEAELARLGFRTERISNPAEGEKSGELLVGFLPGKKPRSITFICHADTVFDEASGFLRFEADLESSTARGPGVIDDKGGIVIALAGIERFLSQLQTELPFSLQFVCAPSEETGSTGFLETFKTLSLNTFLVLGFEPALERENGALIDSRRGNRWYHIRVLGREAHSGRNHAHGVNAGFDLATKLCHLQSLTDYTRDLTVSIASLRGGSDKFNVVCGEAEARVDVRFKDFESRAEVTSAIERILNTPVAISSEDQKSTSTEIQILDDCPPFEANALSAPFREAYQQILQKIEGVIVGSSSSGGAADSNYFSRKDLPVIDGLGAKGGGLHTIQEFIQLESLHTRSQALAEFLTHLALQK